MKQAHGTPFHYTNGQLATVASRIITALPKGLASIDPKVALKHSERGDRLEAGLGAIFEMLHSGNCDTTYFFSVISDGTTGEGWVTRLKKKNIQIGDYVETLLRSLHCFKPTNNITTYITILRDTPPHNRKKDFYEEAHRRNLIFPTVEVACLMSEMLMNNEITMTAGLKRIIIAHNPVLDPNNMTNYLNIFRKNQGLSLELCLGHDWEHEYGCDVGIAFAGSHNTSVILGK